MDGRALLAGVDLYALPLDRALNVATALAVDDTVVTGNLRTGEREVQVFSRARARSELLDRLARAEQKRWNPRTWGELPKHQAATQAAMSFLGGPAEPRQS